MKKEIQELKEINAQLIKALGIISNSNGDYTQNLVYDALVEVGYYEEEELDEYGDPIQ